MTIATLLALLLAAGPPAVAPTAAQPVAADPAPRDWDEAPPGGPEDQALWRRLRDAGNAAVVTMGRVSQAAYRIRYGGYYQGLDEAAKVASASAERARALRGALERAAREADEAIPKAGLRVRTCRYTLLELDTKMGEPDPAIVAQLPGLRVAAEACAREVEAFASALEPRAEALDGALAEVDAFLGRARPLPPPPVRAAP
jgi:hypothetical protein